MGYSLYLGKMLAPVTPAKLEIKTGGKNETVTLINEGEINILKKAALKVATFELLLPNQEYGFAQYKGSFRKAEYFLKELEQLKGRTTPFQWIVTRRSPEGKSFHNTNLKVSLEDYSILEDSKNLFDVTVKVTLKECRDYGTKVIVLPTEPTKSAKVTKKREESAAPKGGGTHTVVKGDTLCGLARKYYGDSGRYPELFAANQPPIKHEHWIYPGQVLSIP